MLRAQQHEGHLAQHAFVALRQLSKDFFSVPEPEIQTLESVPTVVGGKVVYAEAPFAELASPIPPVSPGWSPAARSEPRSAGRSAGCGCSFG